MIAPLHLLVLADEAAAGLPAILAEPLRRAGYQAHFHRVFSVNGVAAALAERRWDAALIARPPAGLTAIDVLAWLERCRASTPVIVLAAEPDEEQELREAGVADILHKNQWHQLGLALARARHAANAPEGTSFATFASRVNIALYRSDLDGRLLYANPAMARILGADSPAQVLGAHLSEDFGFPRETFTSMMQASGEVEELLVSWRKHDGESLLLRETAWSYHDAAGAPIGHEGMIEILPLSEAASGHGSNRPGSGKQTVAAQAGARSAATPQPSTSRGSENGTEQGHAASSAPPAARRFAPSPPAAGTPPAAPAPQAPSTPSGAGGDGAAQRVTPQPTIGDAGERRRMLLLEDNTEARQLLQRMLRSYFDVDAVGDAKGALDLMKRGPYDILLMDIHLGGKESGADVLRKARTLPGYDDVMAIAITAYALPGDRDTILSAGFDAYISKPFTLRALLQTLGEPAKASR